ncbi:MAG: GGDEF domain-containing protein [Caldimicrobium sp.]
MARVKKKLVIYSFWNKDNLFKEWKETLFPFFNIKSFYEVNRFFDALLFNPPNLILYYYEKDPESFQILLRDIKLSFNLVRLPIILIVDRLEIDVLSNYLTAIDDILTTKASKEELLIRIKLAISKLARISDNNPLTGLPGNVSIEMKIKETLGEENPFAVMYIDLDNFKAYNDLYGFAKGDEMIKSLSKILVNTVNSINMKKIFVGHIGGDDFVVIVPLEKAEEVAKEIIKRFDTLVAKFVSQRDFERGYFVSKDRKGNTVTYPLPSVSIAIVPVMKGKFKHIGEVAERAGQIKKVVKALPGSAYFVDRRA